MLHKHTSLYTFNTVQPIDQSHRTLCSCQRLLHIISVGKFKLAKGRRVKHHVWRGSSISTTESKVSAVSNHIQGNPTKRTRSDPAGSRGCLKRAVNCMCGCNHRKRRSVSCSPPQNQTVLLQVSVDIMTTVHLR